MMGRGGKKTPRRAQQGNREWVTLIECLQWGNDFQLSTSTQGQHTMQAGIEIGILTLKPSLRTQIMAGRAQEWLRSMLDTHQEKKWNL